MKLDLAKSAPVAIVATVGKSLAFNPCRFKSAIQSARTSRWIAESSFWRPDVIAYIGAIRREPMSVVRRTWASKLRANNSFLVWFSGGPIISKTTESFAIMSFVALYEIICQPSGNFFPNPFGTQIKKELSIKKATLLHDSNKR